MSLDFYKMYQSSIKTGDIIEFQGNSFLGRLIRKKTGQEVNHTTVVDCMGENRRYIWEAIGNGFHPCYLSNKLKDYDGKVYWLQLKPIYDSHRERIITKVISLEGRPYGYFDIIKLLFGKVKLDLNDPTPVCSAAIQISLIMSELLSKDYNDGYIMVPGEFGLTGLYFNRVRIY